MKRYIEYKEDTRAQPVQTSKGWKCSKCNTSCYYDGRCGDGPILMCNCNEAEDDRYSNEKR